MENQRYMWNRKIIFRAKDRAKFSCCNKLITRGAPGTSSDYYEKFGIEGLVLKINPKVFLATDIVGISANGLRRTRVEPDFELINAAMLVDAVIVLDGKENRSRPYNLGEREVAAYLRKHGYTVLADCTVRSLWGRPINLRED